MRTLQFIIPISVLIFVFIAGCEQSAGDNQASNSSSAASVQSSQKELESQPHQDPSRPPVITFENTVYDFGSMLETEQKSAKMPFTNTGGQTLVITDIKTTCGCTAAKLDKRSYLPGEGGEIEVEFDPTGPGEQKKYVNVISNVPPDGLTRLMITADVRAFITIDPKILRLGAIPFGEEYKSTISVSGPSENFVLESVKPSNSLIQTHVTPSVAGQASFDVEVRIPATAPWGPLFSWIEITGRGKLAPSEPEITHTSKVRVMAQVYGELHADPDTIRFGVKPGEAFERRIRLKRVTGQPFTILSSIVSAGGMPDAQVSIQPVGVNEYDLVFTAVGSQQERHFSGVVILTTDVPGEEEIQIPISGVVRSSYDGVR